MAPLVRTGGSRHTGLAAPPHRNIHVKDLKEIRDYISEDNKEYAARTVQEIYNKFENLQMFPGIGAELSKRVSFQTDYKYAVWEDYTQ